ncbi:DUF6151 family protein [Bdellovibrio sp. HCB209]|uniref:DUF6151 family protein n=1 Tax=Bdellovibrio sp. HCB209 TaxID=3394354 RepID=UPI0039B4E3A9
MQIQCDCGSVKAELKNLPQNTPGRCVCYCTDCQTFAHHLGRTELLDEAGGTEIIPVYPVDMKIQAGEELLRCVRLSPKGLFRWYTSCCKTPMGNTTPGFPWIGLNGVIVERDESKRAQFFGEIKSRIEGKGAIKTPPAGTSMKTSFKDLWVILPFLLKGFIGKKMKVSPYFMANGETPVKTPQIMPLEERNRIRETILQSRSKN